MLSDMAMETFVPSNLLKENALKVSSILAGANICHSMAAILWHFNSNKSISFYSQMIFINLNIFCREIMLLIGKFTFENEDISYDIASWHNCAMTQYFIEYSMNKFSDFIMPYKLCICILIDCKGINKFFRINIPKWSSTMQTNDAKELRRRPRAAFLL